MHEVLFGTCKTKVEGAIIVNSLETFVIPNAEGLSPYKYLSSINYNDRENLSMSKLDMYKKLGIKIKEDQKMIKIKKLI